MDVAPILSDAILKRGGADLNPQALFGITLGSDLDSDRRFFMTLILCGSFLLFAMVATNHGTADTAATSTGTTTPGYTSEYGRTLAAADYSQTTTSSTTVHRPSRGTASTC